MRIVTHPMMIPMDKPTACPPPARAIIRLLLVFMPRTVDYSLRTYQHQAAPPSQRKFPTRHHRWTAPKRHARAVTRRIVVTALATGRMDGDDAADIYNPAPPRSRRARFMPTCCTIGLPNRLKAPDPPLLA